MEQYRFIHHALISVSDKTKVIEFSRSLFKRGVKIFCTKGTATTLVNAGIPVKKISDYIDFPEIMKGRIKTIHPKIYGGILGQQGKDDKIMEKHSIIPIEMVVCNLYPFKKKAENKNSNLENIIKYIDIGGQTMLRAAAKNYKYVASIVEYADYENIITEMDANKNALTLETRLNLAKKTFQYIANYEKIISNKFEYFSNARKQKKTEIINQLPEKLNLKFVKKQNIRYGENSHQNGAFYVEENILEPSIATSKQLQGKTLSYNNITDADAALECIKEFDHPACVIIKHANPCGVAVSNSISEAYELTYKTDPNSAFGGIIAFNRELDENTTKKILFNQFAEIIIAPTITEKALQITNTKKNLRVLVCGKWKKKRINGLDFKRVNGGIIVQNRDIKKINLNKLTIVTNRKPTKQEFCDALFAWKVAKFVKSNAIVFAYKNATIGIGAGQMSRSHSIKIAAIKAQDQGFSLIGSTMASDAFFAFRDNIDIASSLGVSCIIQPGGSIRDNEIIHIANEKNIAMIFTKIRHLRH